MSKTTFKAFCEMLMCADPWPVPESSFDTERVLKDWADIEARRQGYTDWIDAYHKL